MSKTWQSMQRLPEDAQGDEVASEEKTTQPEHGTIKQRETSIGPLSRLSRTTTTFSRSAFEGQTKLTSFFGVLINLDWNTPDTPTRLPTVSR